MLSSNNNTGKSTISSSKLSNTGVSAIKPKKENFLFYWYRKMMAMFSTLWGKARKTLWITSTGTYHLIQDLFY